MSLSLITKNMENLINSKMTYISHLSWFWIKQRPQFLAEGLSKHLDIRVISREEWTNLIKVINLDRPKYVKFLMNFPFILKFKFKLFQKLNEVFIKYQLKRFIKGSEFVWVTSSLNFDIIDKLLTSKILIYDCMDDFLEFPTINISREIKQKFFDMEKMLVERSNLIFCSSERLKKTISERYNIKKEKIEVVNNAVSRKFIENTEFIETIEYTKKNDYIDFMYIGTISEWFDLELIIESLNKFETIRFVLIGASDISIPSHDRLIYLGVKEHTHLFSYMIKSDVLIMPFKVTNLIKSVNPVKIYEYIHIGKPIITSGYPELEQFNRFVEFYYSKNEFFELINMIINKKITIQSKKNRNSFILNNTWDNRINQIIKFLNIQKTDHDNY